MKKVMFLLLSVLFATSAIAQKGSAHEVIPFEADGVKANSPIDVTTESSMFEQKYFNHFGYIAYAGDYVAGISYYGYNPGKELKRHVKIWMTERKGEWICMYDGDITIPSGGSEDEHISLLNVSFDTPMQLKELFNFFLKIECTGETSEKPLYFEYNSVRNSPVARYAIMSELKYISGTVKDQDGKPVKDAHVQLYNDDISVEGVTDAEGAYQIRVDQSNAVYMVSVTAPGYATYRIEFTDDAIRLKDAGTVTEKDFVLYNKVSYKKEQRATIILPIAPNPAWGRYYRLDRREGSDFYFERERTPQANVPYVIFPSMDFELNLGDYDLQQEPGKTVAPYPEEKNEYLESISGIIQYATFYGSYQSIDVSRRYEDEPLYFLDATPDCGGNSFLGRVGACRAYLRMLSPGKDTPNVIFQDNDDYRPFVEDGKVWKVGSTAGISDGIVQMVDYYYFDGDTIIGGKTCKQMMCQKYVGSDFSDAKPNLSYVGAWYEEDKKVYFYDEKRQSMTLKYDFSLDDNESLQLIDDYPPFIIGPKQTGGLEGFKGVYRDVMISENIRSTTWLEGVGGLDGPTRNAYAEAVDRMPEFLMSCTVGDEVIYLNDKYEDGATPEITGSRKNRFDFSHTVKTKPKSRTTRGAEPSLYGEYNDQQLGINLNPLYDAYLVSITDETGKIVYEKNINAGTIVGLNIDISAYAKGRYTVTVENTNESFTGQFETQTAGISDAARLNNKGKKIKDRLIYNLQGQRLNAIPSKGLYIQDGKKYLGK